MGAPDCGVKAKQHVDTTVGLSLASNEARRALLIDFPLSSA